MPPHPAGRPPPLLRLALALCCASTAAPARAQQAPPAVIGLEETPTRGVIQPGNGPADGAEPFAVTVNPAALGALRGATFGLRHSELPADSRLGGRGTGAYLAAPLPYLSRLQVGAALELLRPTGGAAALTGDLAGRLALSISGQLLPGVSLGLGYAHLFTGPSAPAAGLNSVDLGLRVHSARHLALGVVLRDLNAPLLPNNAAVQRAYELELLARPTGDDRLELALGGRVGEQRGDVAPRARLVVRPVRGLALGADAAILLGTPERAVDREARGVAVVDWRLALGAQIDLGQVGGSLYGMVGSGQSSGATGSGDAAFAGGSIALRVSRERYPAIWDGPADVLYRVEPGGLEGVAFLRLLLGLRAVERDRRARGVILLFSDLRVGWGRATELRAAILRLRAAGKRVFVYAADLSTKGVYVASAAERVFLDPAGSLRVSGISFSTYFVKEALDALGVRAELLRVGDYKATPETFLRPGPSDAAREQRQTLADDLYEGLRAALSQGRRVSLERAAALIDRGLFTPKLAAREGLVDLIAAEEEVEAQLTAALGTTPRILALPPLPGDASADPRPARDRAYNLKAVAVINLEGDLLPGDSLRVPFIGLSVLGLRTVVRALQEAAADPQVRALVLRIESPGGSAEAADLIAREVSRLKLRLPVLCSFGDVAASGGYYLAAPCDRIYASAGTLTGSIGIFGGKVDLSGLARRVGVASVPIGRGPHADMEQPFRPYSDPERALVQEQLQAGYDRFLDVIVAGRRLPRAQVEASAAGRVFTGPRALRAQLVDELGGLADAVAEARRRAGLRPDETIALRFYPRAEGSPLGRLLGLLGLPALPGLSAASAEEIPQAVLLTPLQRIAEGLGLPAILSAALLQAGGALARLEGPVPR